MPEPGLGGNSSWGDDWEQVRSQWSSLDPAVAHLNHGSYGAVPDVVAEEQQRWRRQAELNPSKFQWEQLPQLMDVAREQIAAFVGTQPSRCLLLPNVTMAIATVLASVGLTRDDRILLTDDTYSGVKAAVQDACRRTGAEMVNVALGPELGVAENVVQAVLEQVTAGVKLAIIDHITSPTATVVEVARLTAELRSRGIAVVIDGAHAPGALALDVDKIGADYYTGVFHKWCCAPRGSAFLAVAAAAQPSLQPAVAGSRMWEGFPGGFEWLGTADYSAMLSVPVALDFFARLGWEKVRAYNQRLVGEGAATLAAKLGVGVPHTGPAPMAVIPLPRAESMTNAEAADLRRAISARGVEVVVTPSRAGGLVRLSAHVYNQPGDYVRMASVVAEVVGSRYPWSPHEPDQRRD